MKRHLPLLGVFALALAARGVVLVELGGTPLLSVLMGDGRQYHAWALEIAGGDWIGKEVFYQAPLYPYFMAVVYALFGPSLAALRAIQALLGAASCVLVTVAGRRFFAPRAGLAAGVFMALYPPGIFFDGLIQKTALATFLLALLLALLAAQPPTWPSAAAGAVLGGLALTRENALVLVPVALAWILLADGPRRARAVRGGAFVLALAAVLVPVGLRNQAIGGRFLVTTAQLGPNLYIGNNPEANGRYRPLLAGRQDARVERRDAAELAAAAAGRPLTPGEVSAYWLDRTREWIGSAPGAWLRLLAHKAFLVVSAQEIVDTESFAAFADASRLLSALRAVFHFGVLGPLAVLGAWLARRRWRETWLLHATILAIAASLVLFYVVGRYRFSLVPALAILAGAGVVEGWALLRAKSWRALAPGLVLVLFAASVQNAVPSRSRESEDLARATTYYNLWVNLSTGGDEAAGRPWLEKTVALAPSFAPAQADLGYLLAREGRLEEATAHLRHAAELAPADATTRNLLGNVLAQQGRLAEAVEQYTAALRLDPDLADAHFKLGLLYADLGQPELARRHLEETVRLAPDFAPARERLRQLVPGGGLAPTLPEPEP